MCDIFSFKNIYVSEQYLAQCIEPWFLHSFDRVCIYV